MYSYKDIVTICNALGWEIPEEEDQYLKCKCVLFCEHMPRSERINSISRACAIFDYTEDINIPKKYKKDKELVDAVANLLGIEKK